MLFRVIIISQHHDEPAPEIDVFYYSVKDGVPFRDFAEYMVVDPSSNQTYLSEAIDRIELDQTSENFDTCCDKCQKRFLITEYCQDKLYKWSGKKVS